MVKAQRNGHRNQSQCSRYIHAVSDGFISTRVPKCIDVYWLRPSCPGAKMVEARASDELSRLLYYSPPPLSGEEINLTSLANSSQRNEAISFKAIPCLPLENLVSISAGSGG